MRKGLILTVFASILLLSVFVIAQDNLTSSNQTDDDSSLNETEDDDSSLNETEEDDSDDLNESATIGDHLYRNKTALEYYNSLNESQREALKARAEELKERNQELREQIKENIQERKEFRKDLRERLKEGENLTLAEKKLILRKINDQILELIAQRARIRTSLNLSSENESDLNVHLSNGRNAQIKIMPETASLRALERLRLKNCNETRNCTIELKEVGKGNATRAVYEARAEKSFRVFGIFKNKEYVSTQVDSETGELVKTHKPWWSWMATEEDETNDDSSEENETNTNSSA